MRIRLQALSVFLIVLFVAGNAIAAGNLTSQVKKGRLFVTIYPEDATIRILEIKSKFHQGMELDPGKYHVEFSRDWYETKKKTVIILAGQETRLNLVLEDLFTG